MSVILFLSLIMEVTAFEPEEPLMRRRRKRRRVIRIAKPKILLQQKSDRKHITINAIINASQVRRKQRQKEDF